MRTPAAWKKKWWVRAPTLQLLPANGGLKRLILGEQADAVGADLHRYSPRIGDCMAAQAAAGRRVEGEGDHRPGRPPSSGPPATKA